ncbi:MAG: hypothetical protein A2511_04555 [Deltaproteobacteria bacterium RIFOXYD12_FULL_50_9]|nr:MAG: hypothetical protein A2511_04555 [Deltaproteobacteria bacterium RIFOXYD12_FULL_50_9]
MALDEPKSNDESVTVSELTFLVDKDLMERCGNIKVDFVDAGYRSGFSVSSTYPLSSGGSCSTSSCGSSGKSCGC